MNNVAVTLPVRVKGGSAHAGTLRIRTGALIIHSAELHRSRYNNSQCCTTDFNKKETEEALMEEFSNRSLVVWTSNSGEWSTFCAY